MRIDFYKELEPDEYHLRFEDYSESFRREIAFGKKLNIFFDFMNQLLAKKDVVGEWINSGWYGYTSDEAKETLRNGCEEFLKIINNGNKI